MSERVASLRVGESVRQVQHVHLLVRDGAQLLVDLLAEDQVARGAGQGPLARTCKTAPFTLRGRPRGARLLHLELRVINVRRVSSRSR